MNYSPTTDQKFIGTLECWFQTQPEVLVLFRYSHAAGLKEFEFFLSLENFCERVGQIPALTDVIAFRRPQLPIRGVVDTKFIERCLSSIPDGSEYLTLETVRRVAGRRSWLYYGSGTSHAELRDDLEESLGVPVAAGLYSPWLTDTAEVVSAVVPDEHGVVKSGVY